MKGGEILRKWLLEARKEKGMTQLEVANKLDISEAYYSYIENGSRQKKMDIVLAAKLAVVFEMPIEQIIDLEAKEMDT